MYIDISDKEKTMANYNNEDNPEFLNNYIVHMKVVRLLAERTISEYYFDIRLFLKYIHSKTSDAADDISDISIKDMQISELQKIKVSDIYDFIFYTSDERRNSERARYRKISSLRSFFKYMTKDVHLLSSDPTKDIDIRVPKKNMPKYLSLSESRKLLETAGTAESRRDYCILTIFLNCGIRLSELVGIDISDIDFTENRMTVLGKGNKKRVIYLNKACIDAINSYIEVRNSDKNASEETALFLSNQKKRISKRRVQQIVENSLKIAGLNGKGITTHKLRHTAATLMYQYGDADVLTLKKLLGHASTATTEIYTHLNDENVRDAVESNPLSTMTSPKKDEK